MNNVSLKIKRKLSQVEGKRTALFFQVICNREVKRVVLDIKLAATEWMAETETVVIPPEVETSRVNQLLQIRSDLEAERQRMQQVIRQLREKGGGSAEQVVQAYQSSKRQVFWLEYIRLSIDKRRAGNSQATLRNYQSSYNAFYEFCGGKDIPLKEVDEKLLKRFEKYQLEKGLSKNTVAFYCRNLKMFWNMAAGEQLVEGPSPFRNISTRTEKTQKRAINEKSLQKLKALNLTEKPGLSFARDLFLFCFYMRGMAFIDLAHLTRANIHGKQLIYVRSKTGQVLKVELLPVMQAIIRKYQCPGQYYLFPILKNKDASWKEYDSALRLQNKRLNILGKQTGVHLSTHVARHSWASIAKAKRISNEVISDSMGHTSMATTQIYIATLDNSIVDKANRIVVMGEKYSKSSYRNQFG